MSQDKTYKIFFTGVTGGPCPVCDASGELVASWGTYAAAGQRVIVHSTDDEPLRVCTLETDTGRLHVDLSGRWYYEWLKTRYEISVTKMT